MASLCGNNRKFRYPWQILWHRPPLPTALSVLRCFIGHLISKTLLLCLRLKSHFFCYPLDVSIYLIFQKRQKQRPHICAGTQIKSVFGRGWDFRGLTTKSTREYFMVMEILFPDYMCLSKLTELYSQEGDSTACKLCFNKLNLKNLSFLLTLAPALHP